jgi:formylglycine-generating enzyme required for sulfatase activity/membrane-associated protease RseP (regulator of RpoE activity)
VPSDDDFTRRADAEDNLTRKGLAAGQKVFGRYVLEAVAGRGGMGVVWRARDEELEREVALKFLPEVVAADPEAVRDLKRETKRCLELTHPHIVRVYDFEHEAPLAAIGMEFVAGQSLAKRKAEAPGDCLTVEELAPILAQLCEALDYAHLKAKVVHRDLKPANILVTQDGEVKVTDFGIARSLSDTQTRLTGRADNTSGTLPYMSPQQLLGADPTPADDIYALGATLYELLSGKPPFYTGDLASQIREVTPKRLSERRAALGHSSVPKSWEETIMACLAKKPEDRPQSAGEVARRLGLGGTEKAISSGTMKQGLPRARKWMLAAMAAVLVGLGSWWYFGSYLPEQRKLEAAKVEQAKLEREKQEAAARAQREKEDSDYAAALQRVEAVTDGSPRALLEATEPVVQAYLATAPARQKAEATAAWAKRKLAWETYRLANAKGGLIIRTDPPGAEVRVGGFAVEKGPLVTLKEVKVGKYPVTVIAPGYEDFRADAEVKENDFAELTATLVRSTGALQIESTPPGLAYGLQGATPERLERSGRTPAKLADLPTGRYRVTVQRDGWPQPVVDTAVVERQKTALVSAEFATGTLNVTSDPAGAMILQKGKEVARTPWRSESVPGDYAFELRLKGYKAASVSGTLAAKNELRLNAMLEKLPIAEEGQAWTVPGLNLEMVYIQPGTFTMGSPTLESGRLNREGPQTQVTLSKGYWLGKTEVTQAQWEALMGNNPSSFRGANRPVEKVSWDDAMEFCRRLTKRERSAGRLPEDYEYTLPTEAQWEYACRAGTTGPYGGNGNLNDMGWYNKNSGDTTHPVGQKQANAWGLYDMHGNVWEWCLDWYRDYPGGSVRDPRGPASGTYRINRGGSWYESASGCRSALRYGFYPGSRNADLGFRLALAPQVIQTATMRDQEMAVANVVLKPDTVARVYLGVGVDPLTPELAQAMGKTAMEKDLKGMVISAVMPDSPAAKAGLKQEDVIVAVDDQPVGSMKVLREIIAQSSPGAKVKVKFVRAGKPAEMEITLARLPEGSMTSNEAPTSVPVPRSYLGIGVNPLTPELAKAVGKAAMGKEGKGMVISAVTPYGPAAKAGLKLGDVILAVNDQPVDSLEILRSIIAQDSPGTKVKVEYLRDGNPAEMEMTLGRLPNDSVVPSEFLAGVAVTRVNGELRRTYQVPDEVDGLVVTDTADSSPFRDNFHPGMVIVQIDRTPADNVAAVRKHLSPGIHFCLVWDRGGFRYISFKCGS